MVKVNYGFEPHADTVRSVGYSYDTQSTVEEAAVRVPTFSDKCAYMEDGAELYFKSADVPCSMSEYTLTDVYNGSVVYTYSEEETWHEPTYDKNGNITKPGYYTYRVKTTSSGGYESYSNRSYSPITFGFYMTGSPMQYDADMDAFKTSIGGVAEFTSENGSISRSGFTTNRTVKLKDFPLTIPCRTHIVNETVS